MIKRMVPAEAKALIIGQVKMCADLYGAKRELSVEMIKEMVRVVQLKFSHLATFEIRSAYRLWATGVTCPGDGAEMYHGEMNVRNFSLVLNSYDEFRKKMISEYYNQEDVLYGEEKEAMHKQKQDDFDSRFYSEIEHLKGTVNHWDQVPIWIYKPAVRLGLLQSHDSLRRDKTLWERAGIEAERQLKSEVERKSYESISQHAQRILDRVTNRTNVVFEKMYVFEKLFKQHIIHEEE